MDKGSYLLEIEINGDVEVGALGVRSFNGVYVYCGSAMGPGGLSRVKRHFRKAEGEGSTHWHIDYLLREGKVRKAYLFPGRDIECQLSNELSTGVHGFGASDCSCDSHLHTTENLGKVLERDHRVIKPDKLNQ